VVKKTLIRFTRLLKISHSPPIYRCISEMVEKRWVYAARRLTSIEFSFDPCNIYRDCPRGVPREAKMCQKCAKMANFWTFGETVEDRWVHATMRLTSIESSFHPACNIYCDSPRVVPREAKMYLRVRLLDLGIDIPTHRRVLLASNVCIFIQLSITSFSVTSLHRQ